jgi:hypothetical protein
MSFKQKDVEKFESDWRHAQGYLKSMIDNPIVDDIMYMNFKTITRQLESLVIDTSDYARSDKD